MAIQTDFPLELVEEILQCLHDDDSKASSGQDALASVTRLNRAWSRYATRLLYHRPRIHSVSSLKNLLLTLDTTTHGTHVEALHMMNFSLADKKSPRIWRLVGSRAPVRDKALDMLLELCPNLIELHLNIVVPHEWNLSSGPVHPRNYIGRIQTLSLGPSVHWLAQAIFQNTIDCTSLTSLTLKSSPPPTFTQWCPLPCLKILRILTSLKSRIFVALLQNVAQTLERLTIERHTFHFVHYPILPHLRTLDLIDITSTTPLSIMRGFLASLPALKHISLSNVEVDNTPWPDTLRLRSLTIGERVGHMRYRFNPSPRDVLNLLTQVAETLTRLEIYDTAIPNVPEDPTGSIDPRTLSRHEQIEKTYFTPTFIRYLPRLVCLRFLRVTCRLSTPIGFIRHLPSSLETLCIRSFMTCNRLEDMFALGGPSFPPSALKEIELVVSERYNWIDEWLKPRLGEVGVCLMVKRDV